MSSNGSLSAGSRSSTDLPEQSGVYKPTRATGENSVVKDGKTTRLQHQAGRHHLSSGMDSTPSTDVLVRRNDSKRRSGGFLLGGPLARKARRVSPDLRSNKLQTRLQIDSEIDDNVSTSSPGSARSSKSQGKAPVTSDRLSVNFERSPTHSASRSGSTAARHSWAPSVSTGRGSLTSQTTTPTNNRASLDPNQLIQMALTLSEGRRRAASGVHTPPAMKGNRRVTSQGDTADTVTPGSPYANDTVRRRTQLSQEVASDTFGNDENKEYGDAATDPVSAFSWESLPDVSYDFSISCLQRAERAKKYFELSHQYRRLLSTLPPLKPDSAPQSSSVGREYNPLQYLRNERLRHERGMRLVSGPEEFENVQQVTAYVDATEQVRTRHRDHEAADRPALPDIRYFQGDAKVPHAAHSRNSTASSRILWFDSEWTFTPMALLADLIWSEDWRNKGSLQDRYGRYIFPQLNPQSPVSEKTPQSPTSRRVRADTLEGGRNEPPVSPGRGRNKMKFLSIHKIEQETAKLLHWHRGRSPSRGSSRSSVSTFGSIENLTADGINIGPLARHMQKEMREQGTDSYGEPSSAGARWDDIQPSVDGGNSRLGRASIDVPSTHASQSQRRGRSGQNSTEIRRTRSFTDGLRGTSTRDSDLVASSTISIDKRGALSATEPTTSFAQEMANGYPGSVYGNETDTGDMDFTAAELTESRQSSDIDRDRQSLELAVPERHRNHAMNMNVPGLRRRLTAESTDGTSAGRGVNKAISRILKDSMLVGFRGPRKGERMTRDAGTPVTEGSDVYDEDDEYLGLRRTESRGSQSGRMQDRHRYDAPLPTFSFPGRDGTATDRTPTDPTVRPNENLSRQNSGKVPNLDIPRDRKGLKDNLPEGHSSSMLNLLSPMKLLRSARSPFSSAAPSAQGSTVSLVSKDRDQAVQVASRPTYSLGQRKWSIADGLSRVTAVQKQAVTMRDVERVRTLFLSSGIKACELCRQENSVPVNRLPLLVSAEMEVGKKIGEVRKCDEFRMAGKLWHKAIADLHRSSENELQLYRNSILPEMRDRIEKLTHAAGEELTAKLQSTADEADAFSTDLNTQQTLAIREVHETIDRLLRRRRRNLVLLRRAGFFMLEWVVVLLMWLLWLVFIVFRVFKVTLYGTYHTIRWMTSI